MKVRKIETGEEFYVWSDDRAAGHGLACLNKEDEMARRRGRDDTCSWLSGLVHFHGDEIEIIE